MSGILGSGLLATSCSSIVPDELTGVYRQAIIDGSPATTRSSVVRIAHRDVSDVCSGVLVAPRLVVTAKHCTIAGGTSGGIALAQDAFRIGFGPDVDHLVERYSAAVHWTDTTDAGSSTVITDGEDVASLVLTADAPPDAVPSSIGFDYQPRSTDVMTWAGFGISSLTTGAIGVRLEGSGPVTGYDPATGVIQVQGPSACFGDSGGPLFLSPTDPMVGIISDVAGSSDATFCDVGLTFACTLANTVVSNFLRAECDSQGGCGPRIALDAASDTRTGSPGDASSDSNDAQGSPVTDGSPTVTGTDGGAPVRRDPGAGCDCSISYPHEPPSSLLWAGLLAIPLARRRRVNSASSTRALRP